MWWRAPVASKFDGQLRQQQQLFDVLLVSSRSLRRPRRLVRFLSYKWAWRGANQKPNTVAPLNKTKQQGERYTHTYTLHCHSIDQEEEISIFFIINLLIIRVMINKEINLSLRNECALRDCFAQWSSELGTFQGSGTELILLWPLVTYYTEYSIITPSVAAHLLQDVILIH